MKKLMKNAALFILFLVVVRLVSEVVDIPFVFYAGSEVFIEEQGEGSQTAQKLKSDFVVKKMHVQAELPPWLSFAKSIILFPHLLGLGSLSTPLSFFAPQGVWANQTTYSNSYSLIGKSGWDVFFKGDRAIFFPMSRYKDVKMLLSFGNKAIFLAEGTFLNRIFTSGSGDKYQFDGVTKELKPITDQAFECAKNGLKNSGAAGESDALKCLTAS